MGFDDLTPVEQRWQQAAKSQEGFGPRTPCLQEHELRELVERGRRLRDFDKRMSHVATCRRCLHAYRQMRDVGYRMQNTGFAGKFPALARGLALLLIVIGVGGIVFYLGFYQNTPPQKETPISQSSPPPPPLSHSPALPPPHSSTPPPSQDSNAPRVLAYDANGKPLQQRPDGRLLYGENELPETAARAIRLALLEEAQKRREGDKDRRLYALQVYPALQEAIHEQRPTFWWRAMSEVEIYRLEIERWDGERAGWQPWFAETVADPRLTLPSDYRLPRFQERRTHWRWRVVGLPTGQEVVPWLDFDVLSMDEQVQLNRIRRDYSFSPLVLGTTYDAFGLRSLAAEQYRQLLRLQPKNPLVENALKRLIKP